MDVSAEILDGAHGGNSHFFFLPPMFQMPSFSGTPDAAVSPTVDVCPLTNGALPCGAPVVQFSLSAGTDGQTISYDAGSGSYQVNWHTDVCVSGPCTLSLTTIYRLRVFVGSVELGHTDIQPIANGSEAKDVNSGLDVALVDGRTLPVHFRIEQGIVGSVTVSPATNALTVGATQQLTATVLDLHGVTLTGRVVTWSSSNTAVATVDANGVVTAVAAGSATITATSEGQSGTATVTVASPSGTVEGTVTSGVSGGPVAGVLVTISDAAKPVPGAPPGFSATVTTDANGQYAFLSVPPASYIVNAASVPNVAGCVPGKVLGAPIVTVVAGAVVIVDLVVQCMI